MEDDLTSTKTPAADATGSVRRPKRQDLGIHSPESTNSIRPSRQRARASTKAADSPGSAAPESTRNDAREARTSGTSERLIPDHIKPPMGTQQPRHEHAASKAWASTQQPRPGRACSSQGLGVLAWARWHAPGRRQQGPWGHAGCLRGSGSMSRAWHAPWVGCQGRGMPLGPLEGHGSIWGGCCCQA